MALTLADDAAFAAAKRLLEDCGYNESGLADPAGEDDPKALLASLFLQAAEIPTARVRELLPDEGFDALMRLGVLEAGAAADTVRAGVLLYPLAGLHIASDFPGRDLGGEDFVFPAISQQTWEYLSILPDTPCESLLEIGTGSGAAALLATRYAQSVVATDISARCLLFAEFNRRLNAVDGVRFVQSDVYDALPPGETFDRIVAHPPYVPWTGKQDRYRHAGPDGEAILRRLVAGLEERLRPGGSCHLATMGLDTRDAPLELRLREMFGPGKEAFDLLVVERQLVTPEEFVLPWREGEDLTFEEAWSLSEALKERRARMLVRCSVLIERRTGPGEARTLRRAGGRSTGAAEIAHEMERKPWDWDWDTALEAAPEIAGEVQLETVSLPTDEGWRPRTNVLISEYPFAFRTDCPPWAVELLAQFDGSRALHELVDAVDADPEEVEVFLGCLLDAGVVSLSRASDERPTEPAGFSLGDETSLAPLELRHADELFALIDQNRERLRQWLGWVDRTQTADDTRAFIEQSLRKLANDEALTFGIQHGGKIAGVIEVRYGRLPGSAEIAYWLGAAYEGRGLMTKAVQALLEHLFEAEGLHRVEIRCEPTNTRSCNIPERLGFKLEGIARECVPLHDRFADNRVYSLLQQEWKSTKQAS